MSIMLTCIKLFVIWGSPHLSGTNLARSS